MRAQTSAITHQTSTMVWQSVEASSRIWHWTPQTHRGFMPLSLEQEYLSRLIVARHFPPAPTCSPELTVRLRPGLFSSPSHSRLARITKQFTPACRRQLEHRNLQVSSSQLTVEPT